MRLTCLELLGYKSFANKTEFLFPEGITAIVGPNGSGKSNIADALRWVLGEQSQSILRAKRTEDLIFAGSEGRPRQGMAEVVATLDNADATLPIDFTEVTITRRAYRSGESEYLLNGARVRLRDVLELLAHSDLSRSTYVVIGQGLVDQALALRPDERRQLIDEAAGIRPYQAKRESTLTRLDETEANLRRVHDILAELTPRVQRLERHAERAYEHARLSAQLQEALNVWHGYQWHHTQEELTLARQREADLAGDLVHARDELAALQADLSATRARRDQHRAEVGTWRRAASEVRSQFEEARRSLAVGRERLRLLSSQHDELRAEIEALTRQRGDAQAGLAAEEATLARLAEAQAERATEAEARRRDLAGLEAQRQASQDALAAAQQRALNLAVRLADRRSRLAQLTERRGALAREAGDLEATVGRLQAEVEPARAEAERLQRAADAVATQVTQAVQAVEARRAELVATSSQDAELDSALRRAEGALQALLNRRAVLDGLLGGHAEDEYGGLPLDEAMPGWRPVGRVAELIRVAGELDRAVEAALGPWLHALVVESWEDAGRVLAVLRQAGSPDIHVRGRASVVPLDALGTVPASHRPVHPLADRVGCDDRFRPLVDALLGDVALADDLATARVLWAADGPRCRYVTPTGEVLEPSGGLSISPRGRGAGGEGVLAREREWRSLPGEIELATRERDRLAAELNAAREQRLTLEAGLTTLERSVAGQQAEQRQRQAAADKARRVSDERERELAWQRDLLVRRQSDLDALDGQAEQLRAELAELEPAQTAAQADVEAHRAEANRLAGDDLVRAAAEAQAALSALQQETLSRLEQQLAGRQLRLDALGKELAGLEAHIGEWASQEEMLRGQLAALEERIGPAEDGLDELARRERELEAAAGQARNRLAVAESAQTQAAGEVRRWEERLVQLRSEIRADLDLVIHSREEHPLQLALELPDAGLPLPAVTVLPEGLERQVQELKRQVRAVGPVDPDLLAEYEATRERSNFLASQSEDLKKAADNLRQIIAELDRLMHQRFDETFEQVAELFARNFSALFGGGSARLVRVESGRVAPGGDKETPGKAGVEIVARPPGKRSQPLSLLSGGERALTAVALIFALLEVSRTPFCLLDEVDAMLDEANIARFRQVLERLAQQTQMIVITHNRGTIQAADTLYGVSMGDQGVSQVVSLKLDAVSAA